MNTNLDVATSILQKHFFENYKVFLCWLCFNIFPDYLAKFEHDICVGQCSHVMMLVACKISYKVKR